MIKLKKIGFVNILMVLILITFVVPPKILNVIFIGVLLGLTFVRHIINTNFHKTNFNKVSLFFILYFFMLLVSLFYSKDLKTGVSVITSSLSFLVIPLIPLFISKKEVNLEFITKSYIGFLCLLFFFLFSTSIYKNVIEGYTLEYVFDTLRGREVENGRYDYFNYWYFAYANFTSPIGIQPIYLGVFTNIAVVFLFYLKKIRKIKYYYFQLITLGLLILLAASRWQILIFALNYFIFIIFIDNSTFTKKTFILVSLVATILAIGAINPVTRIRAKESFSIKEAFYQDHFGGTSIRLKKWTNAIRSIAAGSVAGYGVGDAKNKLLDQYKKDKFYLGYYNKYNSHNQYLDTLLYGGLFSFLILILIFFYAYKYAVNKIYLLLMTNVFSVGFFTESMLSRQWGVVSFSFFLIIFTVFEFTINDD
jgi:hypothetical protein